MGCLAASCARVKSTIAGQTLLPFNHKHKVSVRHLYLCSMAF
jgi:hypothetical protein